MDAKEIKAEIDRLDRIAKDHAYLVAVIGEMAVKLRRTGKLTAKDQEVFAGGIEKKYQREMPYLVDLLEGYYAERQNGNVP